MAEHLYRGSVRDLGLARVHVFTPTRRVEIARAQDAIDAAKANIEDGMHVAVRVILLEELTAKQDALIALLQGLP